MGRAKMTPVAIAYDFDGTLAPGNMQERNFIPELKLSPAAFWKEVKRHAEEHDMDEILAYMELMLKKANENNVQIMKTSFRNFGKYLKFFPGVNGWFDRITKYGKEMSLSVDHFVISSGLREMIEGSAIGKKFKRVYASGFRYDQHGVAIWPALAVNYTNKTQYLFRINKGIMNSWDNSTINKFVPDDERPVPFENIIYLGDGDTDIPAMKMTCYKGGRAIAVFPPKTRGAKERALRLVEKESRANAAARADYCEGKPLDKIVKSILDEVAARVRGRRAGESSNRR